MDIFPNYTMFISWAHTAYVILWQCDSSIMQLHSRAVQKTACICLAQALAQALTQALAQALTQALAQALSGSLRLSQALSGSLRLSQPLTL